MKQCMRCSLHKLLWTIVHCEFLVFIANDIQASYTAQFKYSHFGLVLLCYLIFLTLFTGFSGKQPPQVFCKDATVNRGMRILFTIFVIIFRSYDLRMHCLCYIPGNFRYVFIKRKK